MSSQRAATNIARQSDFVTPSRPEADFGFEEPADTFCENRLDTLL